MKEPTKREFKAFLIPGGEGGVCVRNIYVDGRG